MTKSKGTERGDYLPVGFFSKLNSLTRVPSEIKNELLQATEFISLTKGSILFHEGDVASNFYLILSGGIKLLKKSNASKTLIDILGTGDLFGAALMLNPQVQSYPVTAITLGPTDVLKYTRDDFKDRWLKSPRLMEFANASILKRIQTVQNDRCMQRFTLEQKVAYFMTEKWISAESLKITRQDIADSIGASQEAVIRLLSCWSDAGLIQNLNQEIKILDVPKLRSLWNEI